MGALPKQRVTRARQGFRRQHDRIRAPQLVRCTNCRTWKVQHHVCLSCGYYAGRQVVEIELKTKPRAS
jgi:large subunit ribosomal protein L32